MSIAFGGSFCKLQSAMIPRPDQVRAPRGAITQFSPAARKRLLELVSSINQAKQARLPLFVTLTYPATWPDEPAVWKRHLDSFLKRLDRKFTRCAAIWKLEFQRRGAPHFHLMVFGPGWIDAKWCARAWYQIVGSGDERHLMAGTQVARVKSWRGVMFYAAKYLGKVVGDACAGMVGRFWGVHRREYLPIELITIQMDFCQFFRLRRLLLRWVQGGQGAIAAKRKNGGGAWSPRISAEHQGFTLFREAARVVQLLRSIER